MSSCGNIPPSPNSTGRQIFNKTDTKLEQSNLNGRAFQKIEDTNLQPYAHRIKPHFDHNIVANPTIPHSSSLYGRLKAHLDDMHVSIFKDDLNQFESEEIFRICRNSVRSFFSLFNFLINYSDQLNSDKEFILHTLEASDIIDPFKQAYDVAKYDNREKQINVVFNDNTKGKLEGLYQGDKFALQILLNNLLSNASKFTPVNANKQITITIDIIEENGSKNLKCSIENEGQGMTPDEVIKLQQFKYYTQANDKVSSKHGGTGVGLPLCNQIATKCLKGKLDIQSTYGKGTTVSFEFPLTKAQILRKRSAANDAVLTANSNSNIGNFSDDDWSKISHEIRTPLNSFFMSSSNILEETMNNSTHSELVAALKDAREKGSVLLNFINNLLSVNKCKSNGFNPNVEQFNVFEQFTREKLIEKLIKTHIDKALLEDHLSVSLKTDPTLPKVIIADLEKISMMLTQLMINAMTFSDENHGKINYSTEMKIDIDKAIVNDQSVLKFTVSNKGKPIDEEVANAFNKHSKNLNESFSSHQFGLSLCARLANLLQGSISVKPIIGGTEVEFTVPYKEALSNINDPIQINENDVTPLKKVFSRQLSNDELKSKRVLILDDNKLNCRMLQNMVTKTFSDESISFQKAHEAIEELKNNPKKYDLVLTDYNLGTESEGFPTGKEVVAKMRKMPSLGHIPVILCSGTGDSEFEESVKDMGFEASLTKPIQKDVLVNIARKVLSDENLDESNNNN
ncbi:MAG: response regulator [Parachlamydiales bacterium]|nr:response regulator [Parachlamydiales bacterium]